MAIKIKYPCLHETAGEKQQQVSKLHIMCNQKTISAMREKKQKNWKGIHCSCKTPSITIYLNEQSHLDKNEKNIGLEYVYF